MTAMPQYRVTRQRPYGPGSPGHTDPRARQGHYVRASGPLAALEAIVARLRDEGIVETTSGIDVEFWSD